MSIFVAGPSWSVNFLKSFGSSYAAQWKKFSVSSSGPFVAVALGAPPVPVVLLVLPHAARKMLPPNAATTDPDRNARRDKRLAASGGARMFTGSRCGVMPSPFSLLLGRRGRGLCGRVDQDELCLLRAEHVRVRRVPRAPHLRPHLQAGRARPPEPRDHLLASGCQDHELDHVPEVRDARERPRHGVLTVRRPVVGDEDRLGP